MLVPDVVDDCVAELGAGELLDAGEHAPGGVLQRFVACYAVHDEDGLDGFGSVCWLAWDQGYFMSRKYLSLYCASVTSVTPG